MFNHKWKPLHYAKSENLRYSWVYSPENSKEGNVTYIVNMFKKVWVQKKKRPQISNCLRQIKNIFSSQPHNSDKQFLFCKGEFISTNIWNLCEKSCNRCYKNHQKKIVKIILPSRKLQPGQQVPTLSFMTLWTWLKPHTFAATISFLMLSISDFNLLENRSHYFL